MILSQKIQNSANYVKYQIAIPNLLNCVIFPASLDFLSQLTIQMRFVYGKNIYYTFKKLEITRKTDWK